MSETQQAEEERRCAGAGPVIEPNYSDRERALFFNFEGPIAPATALLALQRAIAEARAGRYRDIGCPPNIAECRDAAALLGSLDLANLGFVHATPGGVADNRDNHRITASFLIHADAHEQEYWIFTIEAEISELEPRPDPIRSLGPGRFTRTLSIDN